MGSPCHRPTIPATTGSAAETGCKHILPSSQTQAKEYLANPPLCLEEESILHCELNDAEALKEGCLKTDMYN